MRWGILFAGLLGLFVLEGTVFQVFHLQAYGREVAVLPRFLLVVLIFVSLYLGRRRAFLFGLLFGLFFDIQYCDVIGVYAFTMALIPYLSALAYQYFQLNVLLIMITVLLGVFMHESAVFLLFELFGLTGYPYHWLDYVPTALLNAGFAILAYRPLNHWLEKMVDSRQDEVDL
ncbi:rod shape-determining protein MreD [Ammoniphilus sp. CFH 90114]|uniref:rod shape-determining protein MreD n=1 Tax=Ammoniphilus sp. CFH 90114 TaxID=2493665 RepID=UPI00100E15A9|nr:rod shape-determining protein MreD [Ammoniphilus sp. CFH 90114]RXT14722.1 rod shape-determining protein MreD [Ammoniphilus sp. CFH 90114]